MLFPIVTSSGTERFLIPKGQQGIVRRVGKRFWWSSNLWRNHSVSGLAPCFLEFLFPGGQGETCRPLTPVYVLEQGSPNSRIQGLTIRGGADIIIEIKCTINVIALNHPETIPQLLPLGPLKNCLFPKPVPGTKKSGDHCTRSNLNRALAHWLGRLTLKELYNFPYPSQQLASLQQGLTALNGIYDLS